MSSITENVVDRLSILPEDILSHVLSLMHTKFAVRTSILSKRWRYIWTMVTNLDFDDTHGRIFNANTFTEFVDRVFKFCKTSHVNLFRLHISRCFVLSTSVSNWIDNAIRLNVRELYICAIHPALPSSLFTCKTLTNLRLDLSACDYDVWEFVSPVYLSCLKTLDIAGDYNPLFVHGCPVLQSLSLELSCCNNEEECIFNIPTLKLLKLIYKSPSNNEYNKVVLCVPKLEYLFVGGGVLCSTFVMEDASCFVGASIACWKTTSNHLWADLLNHITGVQNLSIENFIITSPLPVFPSMKQLELKGLWQSGHITQLLESCPELKVLCIDLVDWRGFKPEESSSTEFEPKLILACMLTKLTTIKFSKCEGDTCDIGFLEYVLGNAQVLKAGQYSLGKTYSLLKTRGSVHVCLRFQGLLSIVKFIFDLGSCLHFRNSNTTIPMK